jgi:RNA polymerase sigma-70 factor (ECF subfamily)
MAVMDATRAGDGRFPNTQWTVVLDAGGRDPQAARTALEALARSYWRPVYAFIRARWGAEAEESKDLTQGFFVRLLDGTLLERASPERGRFRGFVKAALHCFLVNEKRDRERLKRGGDRSFVPLDGAAPSIAGGRTPDQVLDEEWKKQLLARAADRLKSELGAEGKARTYAIFEEYFLAGQEGGSYRDVAARHAITESAVSDHLMAAKRRYRDILRDLVAETVEDTRSLDEEWRALFPGQKP